MNSAQLQFRFDLISNQINQRYLCNCSVAFNKLWLFIEGLFQLTELSSFLLFFEIILLWAVFVCKLFFGGFWLWDVTVAPFWVQVGSSIILVYLWFNKWNSIYPPFVNQRKAKEVSEFLSTLGNSIQNKEAIPYPITISTEPFYPGLHLVRILTEDNTLTWVPFDLCIPNDDIFLHDLISLAKIDSSITKLLDLDSIKKLTLNNHIVKLCRLKDYPLITKTDAIFQYQNEKVICKSNHNFR